MALVTRTITINPAFLQEIKDDHHELRQLMHHTAASLNRPTWMHVEVSQLVDLFTKLRDQLAMHFSLEEAYGYFDDAIDEAPHLSRRAEHLRSQHFQLFSQMCALVDQAEALLDHEHAAFAIARLADGFHQFEARLQQHETSECELIVEAANEELGTGD
jgi:hypothetical protein